VVFPLGKTRGSGVFLFGNSVALAKRTGEAEATAVFFNSSSFGVVFLAATFDA
jgi:hypothetical protein